MNPNKPSDIHPLAGISVVVPVYRGEETLPDLVARLVPVLTSLAEKHEILLVNDGSPDGSWEVICSLQERTPSVKGICLKRNYGQHNATLCGVRAAQYPIIVTMDDDLQHPPEEIPLLVGKLSEGFDVTYGVPRKMPHSWWRNQMSRFTKRLLAKLMGLPTVRDVSAFRAFRAHLREAFVDFRNPNVILDVLLAWGTTRFSIVVVDEEPRQIGQSNYGFLKLVNVTMVVLTGFSTAPLRFASTLGFLFTIFGGVIFLYVIWIYLFLGSVPGFPFLASIIALFSGIQLFSLGIIGEYLARVFDRSIDRPPYVIGETTAARRNTGKQS
jgi:glycosyltransferase involved in cell wall biosynthesis